MLENIMGELRPLSLMERGSNRTRVIDIGDGRKSNGSCQSLRQNHFIEFNVYHQYSKNGIQNQYNFISVLIKDTICVLIPLCWAAFLSKPRNPTFIPFAQKSPG